MVSCRNLVRFGQTDIWLAEYLCPHISCCLFWVLLWFSETGSLCIALADLDLTVWDLPAFLPDAGMCVCTPPSHSCPLLSRSPWWAAAAFLLAQACLFVWLPLPRQCPKAASCVGNLKDLPCQLTDKQPNTMPRAHVHRGITYSDWENGGYGSANRWIK